MSGRQGTFSYNVPNAVIEPTPDPFLSRREILVNKRPGLGIDRSGWLSASDRAQLNKNTEQERGGPAGGGHQSMVNGRRETAAHERMIGRRGACKRQTFALPLAIEMLGGGS